MGFSILDRQSRGESTRVTEKNTALHMTTVAVVVLFAVAAVSATLVGVAAADSNDRFNATQWDSSGTDRHSASDTSDGGVAFNWDTNGFSGSWDYVSTSQRNETLKVDWGFSGCHSFYLSDAKAYIYADGPEGGTREKISDTGGCSFSRSGTHTVEVHEGYEYGVEVTGSHSDSRGQMDGTFTLRLNEDVDSVEIEPGTSQTVEIGGTVEFEAEALNAAGNVVEETNEAFEWQNTDDNGVFEAVKAGTYEVTATYDGVTSAPTEVVVPEVLDRREVSRGQEGLENRDTRNLRQSRTGGETEERGNSGNVGGSRRNTDRSRRNRGR